jgi:hypothetical protein
MAHTSYVLLKDSHIVYTSTKLAMIVKFLMPPKNHCVSGNNVVYELPNGV